MADWLVRHWKGVGMGVLTVVIIPVVLSLTGVMDLRLPYARPHAGSSTTSRPVSPSTDLAKDSPVKVVWTGNGDTVEAAWQPMNYPGLAWYSVDVYGLAPVDTWYNVGYRLGDELRTSAVANPIADVNEHLKDAKRTERVGPGETWKICVTGMRKTPGGADTSKYVIARSKLCSDDFVIPEPK